MSDIRTRTSVGKRRGNQTQSLLKLENEPDLTLQKLTEDCQSIVNVRKRGFGIKQSTRVDMLLNKSNQINLIR